MNSLIKKAYKEIWSKLDDTKYRETWSWNIRKLLDDLESHHIWNSQKSIDKTNYKMYKNIINARLIEHFRVQWLKSAKHSHKGLDYVESCLFDCNLKHYLNYTINDKSVVKMLRLRTGNHKLAVETER